MSNETNKTKKEVQTKNLRHSEKIVDSLQGNHKEKVRQYLLHLLSTESFWVELAYRPSMGKGFSWSISKVRPTGFATPVLQLQYKQRRNGSRLLSKHVKRNWRTKNVRLGNGQKSANKKLRPLLKIDRRIYKDIKLPKNWGKLKHEK